MSKQRELNLDMEKTKTILEGTAKEIAKKTFNKAIARLEGRAPYPAEHKEYLERNPLRFLVADGLGDISVLMLQVAEGITALRDNEYDEPPPIEDDSGVNFIPVDGVKHWDKQKSYPVLGIMALVSQGVKMTIDYYRLLLEDYLDGLEDQPAPGDQAAKADQAAAEDQPAPADQAAEKEERIIKATREAQKEVWGIMKEETN